MGSLGARLPAFDHRPEGTSIYNRVMRVSQLGEFGLIDALCRRVPTTDPALRVPLGDDAAVWDAALPTIATTDTLVEDVHFRLGEATPAELGWKSLAVNLSDIAAMGGRPRWALVTLGLRPDMDTALLTGLYDGLGEACHAYGVVVAGGDVVSTRGPLFLTVTLLGETLDPTGEVMRRSAARAGDVVAVTGMLGGSGAWLHPDLNAGGGAEVEAIRRAHFRPIPRVAEGQCLLRAGVRCAMDVSDGLVADLGHICQASGVAARIEAEQVPRHPAAAARLGPAAALDLALSGGEDYELLVCAPADVLAGAGPALARATGTAITEIGRIEDASSGEPAVRVVDASGAERPLARRGWDHLRETFGA